MIIKEAVEALIARGIVVGIGDRSDVRAWHRTRMDHSHTLRLDELLEDRRIERRLDERAWHLELAYARQLNLWNRWLRHFSGL